MAMMNVCGPVFCPLCKPQLDRIGKQRGVVLRCSESNYSGCGVDMANCPKCGKGFQISYKIDEVARAESWDVDLEDEKRAQAESAKRYADEMQKKADEAKAVAEKLAAKSTPKPIPVVKVPACPPNRSTAYPIDGLGE